MKVLIGGRKAKQRLSIKSKRMKKGLIICIVLCGSVYGFSQDCRELFFPTFGDRATYYENDEGYVVEVSKSILDSRVKCIEQKGYFVLFGVGVSREGCYL